MNPDHAGLRHDPACIVALVVEDLKEVAAGRERVVLPGEPCTGCEVEVARLAAETPDDLARVPIDLVDRPGVAARDQEVPVDVEGDRVDVEVVVRRFDRLVAVGERYVIEAVPFEEHTPACDVDLLDDTVDGLAVSRASDSR